MIDVRDMTRTYRSGSTATAALRGVTFTVGEGTLVALVGRSGSGKTTLLNIVGGLHTPDGGSISVAGHDMTVMGERERLRLRRETVAFIFQSFGLLPVLVAAENAGVPLRIAGVTPKERESRVELLLSKVGSPTTRSSARPNCPAVSSSVWRSLGRYPATLGVTALIGLWFPDLQAKKLGFCDNPLTGTADELATAMLGYAELGVQHIMFQYALYTRAARGSRPAEALRLYRRNTPQQEHGDSLTAPSTPDVPGFARRSASTSRRLPDRAESSG